MEKIPQSRFEEIYFTKNTQDLINTINEAYGDQFYDQNKFYFDSIMYASDVEMYQKAEILKNVSIVNDTLKKYCAPSEFDDYWRKYEK